MEKKLIEVLQATVEEKKKIVMVFNISETQLESLKRFLNTSNIEYESEVF